MFLSWEFPPNGTGVGAYVAAMARALVAAGHRVVVATGKAAGCAEREEGPSGLVCRCYDRSELRARAVLPRVLELARRERVDWIECADHLGEGVRLLRLTARPPVVLKAHNCNAIRVVRDAEVLYGWQRVAIAVALLRSARQLAAERASLRLADRVLTPSERLRRELVAQGLRRSDEIAVLPNPAWVTPMDRAEAATPTILFAGRVSIGKGIQYLPAMLATVCSRFPNARLEIAGGQAYARGLGWLQPWLLRQLGPLAGQVRFLGKLGAAELDAAYRRAWVLVLPSRWDNFPNVVLEAMARAIPVVASPHGGMPEMLESTGCPVVAPESREFGAAVADLLSDAALRTHVGLAARARVAAQYGPETVARRYVAQVGGAWQ